MIIGSIVFLVVLFFLFVKSYNNMVSLGEAVENAQKSIDVQLDRRFKVFESLINVVNKVMDYEKTTLKDIVGLRNQSIIAAKNGDSQARVEAEESISRIAGNIGAIFESYPTLKAMDNASQLQEEIVSTENKLSFAKQNYNDTIENFNSTKKSFFGAILVSAFPNLNKRVEYWQNTAIKNQELDSYTVNL